MRTLGVRRMGKDQRVGTYITAEGGGGIFAGYTKCEHGSDYKVVLKVHEVRELAKTVGFDRDRENWKVRIARKLYKWASGVIMREATRG